MPHQDGYIHKIGSTTPKKGVSLLADIKAVLGSSYDDIGHFVKSNSVNAFSKVHPQYINHIAPATMAERETAKYGLTIPSYSNASNLISGNAEWKYNKGQNWYRLDDFDTYYHYAPTVLTCPVSGTVVMNAVDETHNTSIPFYAFSLGGGSTSVNAIYNKELSLSTGIGSGDAVSNSTYRSACLSVEDLTTSDGGEALINNNVYFGVALFQNGSLANLGTDINGNPRNPIVCTHQLRNDSSTLENGMFILSEGRFSGILGSYTAIPCLRIGNPLHDVGEVSLFNYVPLCKEPIGTGTTYPCEFSLNIGGVDLYKIVDVQVSDAVDGVRTTHLYTYLSTVYLFVTVQNNSGKSSYTSPGSTSAGHTLDYWLEKGHLYGSVTYSGDTLSTTLDRDTDTLTPYVNDQAFTIPNGGTQTLVYKIDRIWNIDPTQSALAIDAGEIQLTQNLYFRLVGNSDYKFAYQGSLVPNITITYQQYNL